MAVAVIVELLGARKGEPITYVVNNTVAVPKGTLMELADNRVASAANAANDIPAGIAAAEKVANDGSTTLACYTNGIFDLGSTGGFTVGVPVVVEGANIVADAAGGDSELGRILGHALATNAGGVAEEVRVLIGKHH